MQLKIRLKLNEPLKLPLSYNHIVQSALLNLGRGDQSSYAENLHDEVNGEQIYRYYCFGPLRGKSKVYNGKIEFLETLELEVRSLSESWIREIENQVSTKGMIIGKTRLIPEWTELSDKKIYSDAVHIKMVSPIVVHTTDVETNHTNYYSPENEEFYTLIKTNFTNKWRNFYGCEPREEISIEKLNVEPKDKLVTKYKGYFYITAWGGEYMLHGTPEALNFLYNAGVGTKNSQGFGMMEIL